MRLIDVDALLGSVWIHTIFGADYVGLNDVKNAPTVELVKHGRWICTEEVRTVTGITVFAIHCSECGKKHELRLDTLTHFCSNCGAKMDEVI